MFFFFLTASTRAAVCFAISKTKVKEERGKYTMHIKIKAGVSYAYLD
jgi:hypothetical protein